MITETFILISIFFLIGAIGVWRITLKRPEAKNGLLLKYFVYLLIVFGVCSLLAFTDYYVWFGIVLALAGSGEIIFSWMRSDRKGFLLLATGFAIFSSVAILFVLGLNIFENLYLLKIYAVVLSFDGFSQVFGQVFGKRKITPGISPNKTLEGFLGGSLIAFGTGYYLFHENSSFETSLVLSLCIVISGFAGDLLASFFKRKCGVKDYSSIIPGHGGILDRFDSFIFTVACMYGLFLAEVLI